MRRLTLLYCAALLSAQPCLPDDPGAVDQPGVDLNSLARSSKRLLRDFDFRLGLRNAFNRRYSDPIASTPGVDTMPQPGRSFFVELIAHRSR
jgi:hypothetical protein